MQFPAELGTADGFKEPARMPKMLCVTIRNDNDVVQIRLCEWEIAKVIIIHFVIIVFGMSSAMAM